MAFSERQDLNVLIARAKRFADGEDSSQSVRQKITPRWVGIAIVLAAALWAWHLVDGDNAERVYQDLRYVIDEARVGVDAAFDREGRLPDRLNDPELSAVVEYTPRWSDEKTGRRQYSLVASMGRHTVSWNSDQPQRYERKR